MAVRIRMTFFTKESKGLDLYGPFSVPLSRLSALLYCKLVSFRPLRLFVRVRAISFKPLPLLGGSFYYIMAGNTILFFQS